MSSHEKNQYYLRRLIKIIVVHSIWEPVKKEIGLWAESNTNIQSNKFSEIESIHPFAVKHNELFEIAKKIYSGQEMEFLSNQYKSNWHLLKLPTQNNHPLISPGLSLHANELYSLYIGSQTKSKRITKRTKKKTTKKKTTNKKTKNNEIQKLELQKQIKISEWKVPVLWIPLSKIIEFSLTFNDRTIMTGIRFGASFLFWKELSKFGLNILLKQEYTPYFDVENSENHRYSGKWRMIMSDENITRMEQFSSYMPPVCQSKSFLQDKTSYQPFEISLNYVNTFLDTYIRHTIQKAMLSSLFFKAITKTGLPRKNDDLSKKWGHSLISQSSYSIETSLHTSKNQKFVQSLTDWFEKFQPSQTEAKSSFRTCFKLIPPEEPENQAKKNPLWKLQYYLQAKKDLSLLVPASKIWKTRSNTFTFLKHRFENPQERLLSDLGKSSHLFPKIEKSLLKAHPSELILSLNEAYAFLRKSASLLKQEGFGIIVPGWWNKSQNHLGLMLTIKPNKKTQNKSAQKSNPKISSGKFGFNDLVEFDWKVALGDKLLSENEFERLSSLKVPLVKIRGQWFELKSEDLEKIVKFFEENKKQRNSTESLTGEMPLQEAIQIGIGQKQSKFDLPVINFIGVEGLEELVTRFIEPPKLESIAIPSTFKGKLRPYQKIGVSWLVFLRKYGIGACLADDMGLGKTIQIIALLLIEKQNAKIKNPNQKQKKSNQKQKKPKIEKLDSGFYKGTTLIICPLSVAANWAKEIVRFAPSLKTMVHHGPDRLIGNTFINRIQKYDVVITTYGIIRRDQDLFIKIAWDNLILDESQNIKNPNSLQTQAIKKLIANHRIALSGTPIENRLSELWSLEDFLNPGFLDKRTVFHKMFALPIEKYNNQDQRNRLKKLIEPIILRRMKSDKNIIKDLPEKIEANIFCNLKAEQATLYKAVVKEMVEKISDSEGIQRKGLILSSIMKLKQICNHPAQFLKDRSQIKGRSLKLERTKEMLEEIILSKEKALIFTQFKEMGLIIQKYLQNELQTEIPFLYGATTKVQRENMIHAFQQPNSEIQIMILSLKAGGVGINLTSANHVFHFDRWWNPAVENQASDRVYRIGQTKNVNVYKFITMGTIEEKINEIIEKKQKLAESIIGSNEKWITELDNEKIKEMFTYRKELAVSAK